MNQEKKIVELEKQVAAATVTDLSTLDTSFKAHCKYDSDFFIEADLNYQSLVFAQEDYQDPIEREKGQFITIDMSQQDENDIDASVTLSVEDAEKLALHILGLCQAVKGEATAATEAISVMLDGTDISKLTIPQIRVVKVKNRNVLIKIEEYIPAAELLQKLDD